MDKKNDRIQNNISALIILLLLTQTILTIFVLRNLSSLNSMVKTGLLSANNDSLQSLIGTRAPSFSLVDTEESEISLSDFLGEPILLIFTSHTCSACQEMYHELVSFMKNNDDVIILVVAMNSIKENNDFLKEYSLSKYPNLYVLSGTSSVLSNYLIDSTPSFIAINSDGIIESSDYGRTAGQLVELTQGIQ
jgi:cytochrome oxidase Cu insertion factor (SCO1/SenC/PrrC family)